MCIMQTTRASTQSLYTKATTHRGEECGARNYQSTICGASWGFKVTDEISQAFGPLQALQCDYTRVNCNK